MSLRELSEKLGQQTTLMHEIGSDIYDYLDSVILSSDGIGVRLDELNATNRQILKTIGGQEQSTNSVLETRSDQQTVNNITSREGRGQSSSNQRQSQSTTNNGVQNQSTPDQQTINNNTISSNDIARPYLEGQNQSSGDALEARRERQKFNETLVDLLREISTNTKESSGGSGGGGNQPKQGKFATALAGGLGVAAKGIGLAAGLGALGFGIGAFFTGLSLGDKAQAMVGTDMSSTKKNMITLGEAFSETPMDGLLKMGVAMAIGSKFGSIGGALKMGLFGAGISAFFGGLALGDKGMSAMGVDGSTLKSMLVNLGEGLNAFSGTSLVALGGLLAFGTAFGAAAVVGLPLLGIGLAGFLTAVVGAAALLGKAGVDGSNLKSILVNTAEGLAPLGQIDGTNLIAVGAAMGAVGVGMAALFSGKGIAGVMDFIGGFFGGDNEEDMFTKLYNGLQPLSTLNADNLKGLSTISGVIGGLAGSLERLSDIDYGEVKGSVKDLGKILAFTIPMIDAAGKGTVIGSGFFDGYPELNFAPGLDNIPQSTFDKINSVVSVKGPSQQSTPLSVNDVSQQSSPTSSNTMSTLIRENNETKNNNPIVIMDNSTSNNVSGGGGGGGTSIAAGNISPFDTYDPYLATRQV